MDTRGTHGLLILYLKPEASLFFPEQYSIETDQDLGPLAAGRPPDGRAGGALPTRGGWAKADGELREPLVWRQGSQGFMSVPEGARHCPRVMVGESGLKMR